MLLCFSEIDSACLVLECSIFIFAGKYMFASSAGFPGQKAYLKKAFDNYIGSISFYYHMFGKDLGSLNIYIQTNSSKTEITSISDNQVDGWKYLCLPVAVGYG